MRLIRDGEKGGRGYGGGEKREIIYLSLHCHHQNDSCIKMGSKGADGLVLPSRQLQRPVDRPWALFGACAEEHRPT